MAKDFGKTWWGEAWLNSLANIDYGNRIPRGARYARNGSVTSIKIKDNVIDARVQGTRRTPYKVLIAVDKFTAEQKQRLIDDILAHPAIVAELLNHKLSPAVLDIARKRWLRVFPLSWKDLRMDCSCPDWAVPCKHLAAVIYKVGQEIDNNPFLVFSLHGVDILAELEKRGISLGADTRVDIPAWVEAMGFVKPSDRDALEEPKELLPVDFSQVAVLGGAMQKLLPTEPPFYADGNFMKVYEDNMYRASKAVQSVLKGKKDLTAVLEVDSPRQVGKPLTDVLLKIDQEHNIAIHHNGSKASLSVPQLIQRLSDISAEQIDELSNSMYAYRTCAMLALHLVAKGNIVPVIAGAKGGYSITWTPFMADSKTREILNQTDAYFPIDSILYRPTAKRALLPVHPAWLVTSCFITAIVRAAAKPNTKYDDVYDMFYQGGTFAFKGVGEQSIPSSIKIWTDHLSMPQLRYRPTLTVTDKRENGSEFLLDVAVTDTAQADAPLVSMHHVFTASAYAESRFAILRDVSLLSALVSGIGDYLAHEAQEPIKMKNADFTRFLMDVVPAMRLLNIQLVLPRSLQQLLRPRPSVSLSAKQPDSTSFLRMDQLLQFNWKVAIGDELVSPEDFAALLGRAEGLIRFKQHYIYVTTDDLKRIEKAFAAKNEMTPSRMLQAALSGEYGGAKITLTDQVKELIKKWTTLQEMDVPTEICATLRPYQKRGYEWMYHNMRLGFGSILADDMGLGKTLQVITFLQKLKNDGAFAKKHGLIVAPTGLLANWQAELQRFAPGLTVFLYHGAARSLDDFNHNILLTSYGLLRTDSDMLKKQKWAVVVIDEAQNIKNSATEQSKAVRSVKADVHIAMSGTPVENRLSEYWSIMDFANKGYLGNQKSFNDEYAKPIQQDGDQMCAERFRRVTAPMMMRRLKTDKSIITDLPDKIEQDEFAMLTPRQAALYKQVLNESMKVIENIDEDDSTQLFKRQGLVLQMMLALKQICNHPAEYLKNNDISASLSGKAEMLLDLVSAIKDSGGKALIFTQFKEMGDMLQRFIAEATGKEPMFLHGGCSIKQRKEMVDRFQNNRTDRFFILSLKAAGTGLNLTAANHVVHYDLWWNPAVEAQATDRAYRIGQTKNVMVHRFITKNTFEERINDMINSKRALADLTVTAGESWIGKLSNKELREIFG